jgi:hypothetical protein
LENIDARARYGILKGRTASILGRRHQLTDRCRGAEWTGERPAYIKGWICRRRVGGSESPRAAQSSRIRGSLPQNGIVMPIANHRAHRPHERDIRRCAVRQGRGADDSE